MIDILSYKNFKLTNKQIVCLKLKALRVLQFYYISLCKLSAQKLKKKPPSDAKNNKT